MQTADDEEELPSEEKRAWVLRRGGRKAYHDRFFPAEEATKNDWTLRLDFIGLFANYDRRLRLMRWMTPVPFLENELAEIQGVPEWSEFEHQLGAHRLLCWLERWPGREAFLDLFKPAADRAVLELDMDEEEVSILYCCTERFIGGGDGNFVKTTVTPECLLETRIVRTTPKQCLAAIRSGSSGFSVSRVAMEHGIPEPIPPGDTRERELKRTGLSSRFVITPATEDRFAWVCLLYALENRGIKMPEDG